MSFVGHHQVIVAYTSARALQTLRRRTRHRDSLRTHAHYNLLLFVTKHPVYIHPELLDRAEQLSHIQSELAAGTQIHYNTKCAV